MRKRKLNNQLIDDWLTSNRPGVKRKGDYKDCKTKLEFECECGNTWMVLWQNIQNGSHCFECAQKLRYANPRKPTKINNQYIDNWILENRPGTKRLGDYKDAHTPLEFQCECGNKMKTVFDNFRRGDHCKECHIKNVADANRLTVDEFDKWVLINRPGTKRIGIFKDAITPIEMQCECGDTWNISPVSFRQGYQCQKCRYRKIGEKETIPQEVAQTRLDDAGYDYDIIEYYGISKKGKLKCRNCGEIIEVIIIDLFHPGKSYLCRNCNPEASISRGERIVLNWLCDNNIDNIFQCRTSINNHIHYFDFYLPKHNMFIEVDGEQHRNPVESWGGQAAFNKAQCRDAEKDMHCHWNGYNLLRIPYYNRMSNEDIIRILENELK